MTAVSSRLVTTCSKCAEERRDTGAFIVAENVTHDLAPKDFDVYRYGLPDAGYMLEHGGSNGWHVLCLAAYEGNKKLVRHIVKTGGEHLISVGNIFGMAPLYCAAINPNVENGYTGAKELVKRGADVNMATAEAAEGYPKRSTPLWAAVEKTRNLRLVRLLLQHGAVLSPQEISDEGKQLLDEAGRQGNQSGPKLLFSCFT